MNILPLSANVIAYLEKRRLTKRLEKQLNLFIKNPFHSGLNTELLEPKEMKFWSFRVDRKYRAIFIFRTKDTIEILTITNHYQ